ncbi:MAG: VWA domain-containing protein, partial [Myxococcales bacterium]|nr:VWA domain-containing protein [Myxococcales bacterium]
MLVLDKSGSMVDHGNDWDHDGDAGTPEVTRWFSLHGVVSTIVDQYEDQFRLGVTLFPARDAEKGSCSVTETPDVGVGLGNGAAILAAIPAASDDQFGGYTPTTDGITTSLAHLEEQGDERPSAMVLVTDGRANCADLNHPTDYDTDLTLAVADAWNGAGVPTFVVGIDSAGQRDELNAVADAGGVPREGSDHFYDASTHEALQTALEDITDRVRCQLEVGILPGEFESMVIEADGKDFPQLQSCSEGDGWVQVDPVNHPNKIELCNAACDAAVTIGGGRAKLECPLLP